MRACTFISKSCAILALLIAPFAFSSAARAEEPSQKDKTLTPEEEDFSETPFTRYGEFHEEEDEEEDTRFLQSGRLFGVGIGLGVETADGNLGRLWRGGFPSFDIRLHYWFDFNWSLDLGLFFTTHSYETNEANGGPKVDVGMSRYGVDLKYQLDTHNLAAPLTFIGPFFLIGGNNYIISRRKANTVESEPVDTNFGFCLGTGLEFTLKPRRNYFQIEGKVHFVRNRDTNSDKFSNDGINNIEDSQGQLYTVMGNFVFTW